MPATKPIKKTEELMMRYLKYILIVEKVLGFRFFSSKLSVEPKSTSNHWMSCSVASISTQTDEMLHQQGHAR